MTELPEYSSPPSSFTTASLSPVSSDSFTSIMPQITSASLQICCPLSSTRISSETISDSSTVFSSPSLSTLICGRFNIDKLSTSFFALHSCIIPTAIFIRIIAIKTMLEYAPTAKSITAIIKFRRLNSVKIFSLNICVVVFVMD